MTTIKEKIDRYIRIFGLILAASYMLLMTYTFYLAYFSPHHEMILSVDVVGEADPEFVMLFVLVPLVMYTCFYYLKKEIEYIKGGKF
jgi:hypothetical protein